MEAQPKTLCEQLEERRERAHEVAILYTITSLGGNAFTVTHPDSESDPECGRSYVVEMDRGHCTCPDFVARHTGLGPAFQCKHIMAVLLNGLVEPQNETPTDEQAERLKAQEEAHTKSFNDTLKKVAEDPWAA